MFRRVLPGIAPVILLLLCHFALRTHHITIQQPYVDEGFHIRRAIVVWDFNENPGRFAHGKVLVYFWIGLFEGPNTPQTILPVARLSIALFSTITGAAIYLLGKVLANHATGILALALYAVLPPAFFYERMAMADPLAAGLMALAVWRCYVFVKCPTVWQGMWIGLLLGLATLAKLTAAMVVLLPFAAIFIYAPRKEGRLIVHLRFVLRRHLPGLTAAVITGIALWLPMLLPAAFAHGTPQQFILVNDTNIARSDEYFFKPLQYIQRLLPLLTEFVTPWFLAGIFLAAVVGLTVFWFIDRRRWRSVAYLLAWLALMTLPAFFIARLVTTRYFMPATVPVALVLAMVIVRLMEGQQFSQSASQPSPPLSRSAGEGSKAAADSGRWRGWIFLVRFGRNLLRPCRFIMLYLLLILLLLWLLFRALPFARTTLTAPHTLAFAKPNMPEFFGTNYAEYVAGYFLGDEAVQSAAALINALPPRPIYATWNLCHLIFFYLEQPVTCLPERTPRATMQRYIGELTPDASVYFVMADYEPFWDSVAGADYEILGEFPRRLIKRPVYVLRMWPEAQG